jgi:TolA-binding protein
MQKIIFHSILVLLCLNLTACFRTRADLEQEEAAHEVKSSLQENVQAHGEQIAELQAEHTQILSRVDQLDHNARLGSEAQLKNSKANAEDLERRLRALEEGQAALFEEVKSLREAKIKTLQQEEVAPVLKKTYNFSELQKLVSDKKFDQATPALQRYIKDNPKSKNKIKAHALLGDSLFASEEYSSAIIEYSEVQEGAADTRLGRQATLRIAESFKKLGKNKDAKTFVQILVEKYPTSDEAKLARKLYK